MSENGLTRMLLNGYNTSSVALSWVLFLLAKHPTFLARVHDEIGDLQAGSLTLDTVRKLPFTRSVVLETLRLYPPAWILGRRALRRDQLGSAQISEGTILSVSPATIQRLTSCWSEPTKFAPDRFFSGTNEIQRFSFFPFGSGNRRCPAASWAVSHLVLLVVALVSRSNLELAQGTVRPRGLVTLRVAPQLNLRFRQRNRAV